MAISSISFIQMVGIHKDSLGAATAVTSGGARGAFAPPTPTVPKSPRFDTS